MTVHDPKAYTQDWMNVRTWRIKPANDVLMEYSCEENNLRNVIDGSIKLWQPDDENESRPERRRETMTGQLLKAMMAAGVVAALSAPLVAHHSISAEFDTTKPITFTGKVTKVEWMNPHIYTHVEAKDPDGKVVVYHVEGGPPNSLFRQGWRKDTLKPGDTVTVSGIRAKIPTSMNIGVATITMADGKRIYGAQGQTGAAGGATGN